MPATTTEMFIRSFNLETGSNFQIIPYKSGNEVANALLTNSVQVANNGIGTLVPQIQAGKFQGDRGRFATTAGRFCRTFRL